MDFPQGYQDYEVTLTVRVSSGTGPKGLAAFLEALEGMAPAVFHEANAEVAAMFSGWTPAATIPCKATVKAKE